MKLANITVRNTGELITPDTRICLMNWAPAKYGKTTFGSTLDKLTREVLGKPTVFIAVDCGDGGGTMSVRDAGVDFVQPANYKEYQAIVTALTNDTHYGGVVLDSASEYVNMFLKPFLRCIARSLSMS